ncbi:MAG: DUF2946 domain-containing protein [Chthonomonadaceae bacterium]|nr:DUF2946 domain-containing protein [Chthonomonadaceae bacterium]
MESLTRSNRKSAKPRTLLLRVLLVCYVWLSAFGGVFHIHSALSRSHSRQVTSQVTFAPSSTSHSTPAQDGMQSIERSDNDHCAYCDWLAVTGKISSPPPSAVLLSLVKTDAPPVFVASLPLSVLRYTSSRAPPVA